MVVRSNIKVIVRIPLRQFQKNSEKDVQKRIG